MKKTLIVISIATAGLLARAAVATAVDAAGPGRSGPFGRRMANTPLGRLITGQIGRMLVLRSDLAVRENQREQIRKIIDSHRPEIARVAAPVVEKKRALRQAVRAEEPDEKKVRAAAEDLGQALGDAAVLAAKVRGQAAEVLTADQLKRIERFVADSDAAVDAFLKELAEAK